MKGDGSINKVKDREGRERYVVAVFVPGRDSAVRRRLAPGATKRQAERALRELRDARARGELHKKEKPTEPEKLPTVGEWLDRWVAGGCIGGLKTRKRVPNPGTQRGYARLIRLDIKPSPISRLRLDEVRRRHALDFLEALAKEDRAESTLVHEIGILVRAWRWAQDRYEDELGDRSNPFEVALPETKAKRERRALDVAETRTLLAATADHRLVGAWVHLGLDCGARPSELAALEWSDLDLEATPATVTITKTIAWEPRPDNEPGEGQDVARLTDGKTGQKGWRKVTISPSTVAALKAHRESLLNSPLRQVGYWPTEQDGIDLRYRVFRTDAGRLVHFATARQQLQRLSDKAGMGSVVPYDLRHTAATLIDEHHGEEVASKALGHKSAGMSAVTAGYIHRRRLPLIDSAWLDLALDQNAEAHDHTPKLKAVAQ